MFNKKIIYSAIFLMVVYVMALAALYLINGKNKKNYSCVENSDCTLIYAGEAKCAPCDQSLDSYICAPPDKAEKIREKRKGIAGNIACAPCPPASKIFSCTCEKGVCQKVKISE